MLILNPSIYLFKSFMCLIVQHHIFPLKRCSNKFGWKTDTIIRFVFPIKQHMTQKLFGHTQLTAKERFSLVCTFQSQNIRCIEPIVALEHSHYLASLDRVITCDNEYRSLSRWQETSVRQPLPTTELCKLPVKSTILKIEGIKCLWLDMRHQSKHHNNPFFKCYITMFGGFLQQFA